MKLEYSGQEKIPAGRDEVWAFVNDPEKVGRCLPEVIDVKVHDPAHFLPRNLDALRGRLLAHLTNKSLKRAEPTD